MAQDRDQYVHFTIKLLKGSFTHGALWQDAVKYHMVDHPEQLIALRLTEYYELLAKGVLRPGPSVQESFSPAGQGSPGERPVSPNTPAPPSPVDNPGKTPPREHIDDHHSYADPPSGETVVSASLSAAEENAEEAAQYWSIM
jgi:hypothetical protein